MEKNCKKKGVLKFFSWLIKDILRCINFVLVRYPPFSFLSWKKNKASGAIKEKLLNIKRRNKKPKPTPTQKCDKGETIFQASMLYRYIFKESYRRKQHTL